jgi:F-type H+-transporting ATPase subunit a
MGPLATALAVWLAAATFNLAEPPNHAASALEGSAHGQEGEAREEEEHDVAGFIFHHVSDSPDYEIEIPLRSGKNPVIHLPIIRIPMRAGACPSDPYESASLKEGCLDLSITKHVLMMWLAAALLIALSLLGARRDKGKLIPEGKGANLLEELVLFVRDELAIKNIGKEEGPRYTAFLLTIFFFILFMNLIGLFPWMATPTSNLGVTAGLALCTFVVTQVASIRAAGVGGYLKHLTGGVAPWLWPIMVPVEFLGLFTKPFALTIRLFANMLAGHIVIFFLFGLIYIMGTVAFALVSVPFAIGIYILELFVALVQSYIFAMLSSLFIGMGVAMGDHAEHAGTEKEVAHSHDHGPAHTLGS